MKIKLIWVGKTKEQFILEGIKKYLKLLKPFADLELVEIKEEKGKDIQRMVQKEGERTTKSRVPYVLLDEKGRNLTSAEFADFVKGHGPAIRFVLGGAYGVSEDVREKAVEMISLSKMTFTHELSRIVFLEQLYRAFTIIHRRGYHH
jgi:23S rRNA (pseudouridine1915-N3)-methyltransferase